MLRNKSLNAPRRVVVVFNGEKHKVPTDRKEADIYILSRVYPSERAKFWQAYDRAVQEREDELSGDGL